MGVCGRVGEGGWVWMVVGKVWMSGWMGGCGWWLGWQLGLCQYTVSCIGAVQRQDNSNLSYLICISFNLLELKRLLS